MNPQCQAPRLLGDGSGGVDSIHWNPEDGGQIAGAPLDPLQQGCARVGPLRHEHSVAKQQGQPGVCARRAELAFRSLVLAHLGGPDPWRVAGRRPGPRTANALLAVLAANLEVLIACIVCPLALLALAAGGAWGAYSNGLLVPLSGPLLGGFIAFLGGVAPRLAVSQRQARKLGLALAAERAESAHLATHDTLTGLANRGELVAALRQVLQSTRRHAHGGALLLLNVDHFKDVNDTLGLSTSTKSARYSASRLTVFFLAPVGR
jgi:hypothetical protein